MEDIWLWVCLSIGNVSGNTGCFWWWRMVMVHVSDDGKYPCQWWISLTTGNVSVSGDGGSNFFVKGNVCDDGKCLWQGKCRWQMPLTMWWLWTRLCFSPLGCRCPPVTWRRLLRSFLRYVCLFCNRLFASGKIIFCSLSPCWFWGVRYGCCFVGSGLVCGPASAWAFPHILRVYFLPSGPLIFAAFTSHFLQLIGYLARRNAFLL